MTFRKNQALSIHVIRTNIEKEMLVVGPPNADLGPQEPTLRVPIQRLGSKGPKQEARHMDTKKARFTGFGEKP